MAGQLRDRHALQASLDHRLRLPGRRGADGVPKRNLVAAHVIERARDLSHLLRLHAAFVGAGDHAGDVAAHLDIRLLRGIHDRPEALERFGDGAVDVLLRERLGSRAEHRDLGDALEATNTELEPLGLYLTHIWGPEQEILGPTWKERCRPVSVANLRHLTVTTLGPLDLLTSKLCRADDLDLADIDWLIRHEALDADEVRAALRTAVVPEDFRDGYAEACARVEALLVARR